MDANTKMLLIGLLLTYLVSLASAILCHQCQTMERKTCSDPYPENDVNLGNLGECDENNYCVKYKTVVKIRDSGYMTGWERVSKVVTRSCELKEGKSEGCTGWQNNGGITIKCWCGSDGCNSSRTLHPSSWALVSALVLSVCALYRHWLLH